MSRGATPRARLLALLALGAAGAVALPRGGARADEPADAAPVTSTDPPAADPFAAPADPFAAPADPFAAPADPFAAPAPAGPAPAFDPGAVVVDPRGRGISLELPDPLGHLVIHGRASTALAALDDDERVEYLVQPVSLQLSTVDLYAEWFPIPRLGLLGEVEVEDDLEDEGRDVEVELELLVVEVRPLGDERLRLRGGFQPVPFGLERRFYAPSRNETITRPAAFRRIFPGSYTDLGLYAWGRLPLGPLGEGELELGLVRGLDGPGRDGRPEELAVDGDGRPQGVGRAGWTLLDTTAPGGGERLGAGAPWRLRLAVGASALVGDYDDDAANTRHDIRLWGADVSAQVGDLLARAELVWGEVEDRLPGAPEDLRGGYALLAWRRRLGLPALEEAFVVGRYDRLDDGRLDDARLSVERVYVGLGWVPIEGLQVKAGWERTRSRVPGDAARVNAALVEVGYSF